jgi:hypothetical protein
MATEARIAPPFTATGKQAELARQWRDPSVRVVCVGGAIRSGKSQAAARLLVESAVKRPSTYLICRSTYRELEDSTKKIVLHGDGSVPPAIPAELVAQYRASDNVVKLKTGSEILFRSLEETNISKLLNITAGAFLIDQAEELDAPNQDDLPRGSARLGRVSAGQGNTRAARLQPSQHGASDDRRAVDRGERAERDHAQHGPSAGTGRVVRARSGASIRRKRQRRNLGGAAGARGRTSGAPTFHARCPI